jgi:hypothetical protein
MVGFLSGFSLGGVMTRRRQPVDRRGCLPRRPAPACGFDGARIGKNGCGRKAYRSGQDARAKRNIAGLPGLARLSHEAFI